MFDLALRQRYPLLLVGPTGTGKTTLIMRHLLGGGSQRSASGEAGQEASGDTSPDSADAGQARDKAAATGPALVGGLTPDKWVPVFLTLSARTTANMAQEQVSVLLAGGRQPRFCTYGCCERFRAASVIVTIVAVFLHNIHASC